MERERDEVERKARAGLGKDMWPWPPQFGLKGSDNITSEAGKEYIVIL